MKIPFKKSRMEKVEKDKKIPDKNKRKCSAGMQVKNKKQKWKEKSI